MKRIATVLAVFAVLLPLGATAASAAPSDASTNNSPAALWCVEAITVTLHGQPIGTTPIICVPGP